MLSKSVLGFLDIAYFILGIVLLNYRTLFKNVGNTAIPGDLGDLGEALNGANPNIIDFLVIAWLVASVLYLLTKGNRLNINSRFVPYIVNIGNTWNIAYIDLLEPSGVKFKFLFGYPYAFSSYKVIQTLKSRFVAYYTHNDYYLDRYSKDTWYVRYILNLLTVGKFPFRFNLIRYFRLMLIYFLHIFTGFLVSSDERETEDLQILAYFNLGLYNMKVRRFKPN